MVEDQVDTTQEFQDDLIDSMDALKRTDLEEVEEASQVSMTNS